MKNIPHYFNIAFGTFIISTLGIAIIDRDIGSIGFIIICIGWAMTMIVRNAVESVAEIFFNDE